MLGNAGGGGGAFVRRRAAGGGSAGSGWAGPRAAAAIATGGGSGKRSRSRGGAARSGGGCRGGGAISRRALICGAGLGGRRRLVARPLAASATQPTVAARSGQPLPVWGRPSPAGVAASPARRDTFVGVTGRLPSITVMSPGAARAGDETAQGPG